jgi:nucleoside-diphosphate-sugar epimerase
MVIPFHMKNGDSWLRGKRVLITGATGFVGGRLAERLIVEHGCEVVTLVRNWTKAVWISRYPAILHAGDIRDEEAVQNAAASCDIVYHCASGGGSDEEYLDTNIRGTQNIIKACVSLNLKSLVFISSIAVHGPTPPDGADENDVYRSLGRGYSESKIAAEQLVLKAGTEHGLNVCILRPTFVWGPRSSLFTIRPLRQIHEGTFQLVDNGRGSCHAVFIEHLVDAIIAASAFDQGSGKAYLVTDGYDITWKDFFQPYLDWMKAATPPSLNSKSVTVKLQCRLYQQLQRLSEKWKHNPAPLWRKVSRRVAKLIANRLIAAGVMNEWDLQKFARVGRFNTESTREELGIVQRYTFAEAMALTEHWVRDQMSVELGLSARQEEVD